MEKRARPEDFLELIRQQNRGKLKVYLGSSAGVGKTYSMLVEGHRLKQQGLDVVIGYLEPHERPETSAQVRDLEIVPPREINDGRLTLREMDLEAVLRRKPTIALIDEFAHTNAAGSRHEKRYQDVAELLEAGISVITTLNIQHLESLYNIVEDATGVRVQERIPDRIVAQADQLVNIDLPAEDLVERLKAGKIYPLDRVALALENFFTRDNLTRLREITMSEVANFLDQQQRHAQTKENEPSASAKVMVALSSLGPHPAERMRKAARLAALINADWYAVYVRTRRESMEKMTAETERILHDHLTLAQKLGGTVITLKNDSIADAIVQFAQEYGVSHLLMGRTGTRPWWKMLTPTLIEKIAQRLPDVDIVLCG